MPATDEASRQRLYIRRTAEVHCYALTGSYLRTARRVGLDRRTVKEKVDRGLLGRVIHTSVPREDV